MRRDSQRQAGRRTEIRTDTTETEKRQPDRGRDRERQGRDSERGRGTRTLKSSVYKDCNLDSVKPCPTTSPCRKETERDSGESKRSGRTDIGMRQREIKEKPKNRGETETDREETARD